MIISKRIYLHAFAITTMILALVRCAVDSSSSVSTSNDCDSISTDNASEHNSKTANNDSIPGYSKTAIPLSQDFKPHKIYSVPCFKATFPDSNNVQIIAAQKYGVPPVKNRKDAEKRKSELVYAAANPYFSVDPLRESIPYLVPRASVLLQDIGRAFYDSLYLKGIPMHQIIATSILRTEEDVIRLRSHNGNASENSCHRYGTTFDICYNRYVTVQTATSPQRQVRNDTLKWVLSEVLRDMRESQRCYIKYEVKQGCFHITAR